MSQNSRSVILKRSESRSSNAAGRQLISSGKRWRVKSFFTGDSCDLLSFSAILVELLRPPELIQKECLLHVVKMW